MLAKVPSARCILFCRAMCATLRRPNVFPCSSPLACTFSPPPPLTRQYTHAHHSLAAISTQRAPAHSHSLYLAV
eukprot:1816352-Amphidinium_carterae.2